MRVIALQRNTIAAEFKRACPCCLPEGLPRDLSGRVTESELRGEKWNAILMFLAWSFRYSVASVEALHARSRRVADPNMLWPTFVSNFISSEAVALFRGWLQPQRSLADDYGHDIDTLRQIHERRELLALPASQSSRELGEWLRAQSPRMLFHKQYTREQKALGRKFNPCTKEFWDETREEFDKLDKTKKDSSLKKQTKQ